jgi:hypothetical protein
MFKAGINKNKRPTVCRTFVFSAQAVTFFPSTKVKAGFMSEWKAVKQALLPGLIAPSCPSMDSHLAGVTEAMVSTSSTGMPASQR